MRRASEWQRGSRTSRTAITACLVALSALLVAPSRADVDLWPALVLSEQQTNVVLRVFTQEPDSDQMALASKVSANRADVYLPPLPPRLLTEMGLSGAVQQQAADSVARIANAAHEAAERELTEESGLKLKRYLSDESLKERYRFRARGQLIGSDFDP